jgi:hypothetical protein
LGRQRSQRRDQAAVPGATMPGGEMPGGGRCGRGQKRPGGGAPNRRCRAALPVSLGEPAGIASPSRAALAADAQQYPSLQGRLLLPSQGDRQAASRKG